MPEPHDSLAKAQAEVARVRSFLKAFPRTLAECNRFGFFRSSYARIEMLSGSVGSLAVQMDRLAESIDSICDALKPNDAGTPD